MVFTLDGKLDEFTSLEKAKFLADLAKELGVEVEDLEITGEEAGSIIATVRIKTKKAEAAAVQSKAEAASSKTLGSFKVVSAAPASEEPKKDEPKQKEEKKPEATKPAEEQKKPEAAKQEPAPEVKKAPKGEMMERPRSRFDPQENDTFTRNSHGMYVPKDIPEEAKAEPMMLAETDGMSMNIAGDGKLYFQRVQREAVPKDAYGLLLATKVSRELAKGKTMEGYTMDVNSGSYTALGQEFPSKVEFTQWLAKQNEASLKKEGRATTQAALETFTERSSQPDDAEVLAKLALEERMNKFGPLVLDREEEIARQGASDTAIANRMAAEYSAIKQEGKLTTPGEDRPVRGEPVPGTTEYYAAQAEGTLTASRVEPAWFEGKDAAEAKKAQYSQSHGIEREAFVSREKKKVSVVEGEAATNSRMQAPSGPSREAPKDAPKEAPKEPVGAPKETVVEEVEKAVVAGAKDVENAAESAQENLSSSKAVEKETAAPPAGK